MRRSKSGEVPMDPRGAARVRVPVVAVPGGLRITHGEAWFPWQAAHRPSHNQGTMVSTLSAFSKREVTMIDLNDHSDPKIEDRRSSASAAPQDQHLGASCHAWESPGIRLSLEKMFAPWLYPKNLYDREPYAEMSLTGRLRRYCGLGTDFIAHHSIESLNHLLQQVQLVAKYVSIVP